MLICRIHLVPRTDFNRATIYVYMYQITECSVLKSDPPIHPSRKETQQTNHYLWAYNTFAQVHYLYFSIILRASSTGSSDGSPIASSNLEPEASFGFIARKPRYMRPIIACDHKNHHLVVSSTIKTEPQKTGMSNGWPLALVNMSVTGSAGYICYLSSDYSYYMTKGHSLLNTAHWSSMAGESYHKCCDCLPEQIMQWTQRI